METIISPSKQEFSLIFYLFHAFQTSNKKCGKKDETICNRFEWITMGMRKWRDSRAESGFSNEKYDIRRLFDKTDFITDLK